MILSKPVTELLGQVVESYQHFAECDRLLEHDLELHFLAEAEQASLRLARYFRELQEFNHGE